MTDLRKAAEMALEALEWNYGTDLCDIENCMAWLDKMNATIPALRQALAEPANSTTDLVEPKASSQPEQEPFIYVREDNEKPFGGYEHCSEADAGAFPVYTAPPISDYHEGWEEGFKAAKREWVGLTVDEARKFYEKYTNREELIYAIDEFLEEKNA